MKTLLKLFCALLTTAFPLWSSAAEIEWDTIVPEPTLWQDQQGFSHVSLEDYATIGEPGQPALPAKSVNLLIPPGHHVVEVFVDPGQLIELPGTYQVAPQQLPRPISWKQNRPFVEPDPLIYGKDDLFPATVLHTEKIQWQRGFIFQPILIKPVFYKPLSQKLYYSPTIHITVVTQTDTKATPGFLGYRGFKRDMERAAMLADNPLVITQYPVQTTTSKAPDYRYVVVTSEALSSCAGPQNLQALLTDKNNHGLSTRIETTTSISAAYSGTDLAEKIRNFIKDMYSNNGADFVLLVGDADLQVVGGETEAPIVPVRGFYVQMDASLYDYNIPSDLYYAALNGTFNDDNDSYYGELEDNPDYLSEVAVGRVPADNCTELTNFVRKTLNYQSQTGDWLKRTDVVGEYLWNNYQGNPEFGIDYLDKVATSSNEDGISTKGFSEDPFYTVNILDDSQQTGDNCESQPSPCWKSTDILAVLNGNTHIVNHLGHSYTNYNMRLTNEDLEWYLTNDNPFFEYTQGCYPGSFDNRLDESYNNQVYQQDSFAEHMTLGEKGAFAVVMNTRYGWGGCSNAFHRTFWDGMFAGGLARLGDLQTYSKDALSGFAGDNCYRWVLYESTLFGDPEIALHQATATIPPSISVSPAVGELYFVAIEGGGNPVDQILEINNVGGGQLNWNIQSDQSWLTVDPEIGTGAASVTVSVDTSSLVSDAYTATLTISAPGADNSPLQYPIEVYVIVVPSELAPLVASATPTIDGVINAGEYNGATTLDLNPDDPNTSTVKILHTGSMLYYAAKIAADTDVDDYDDLMILFDNDNNNAWPTSRGAEGYLDLYPGYTGYKACWNTGSGLVCDADYEWDPTGVTVAFNNASPRIVEVAINLTTSYLQKSAGTTFGTFILYYDYDAVADDWTIKANWPWVAESFNSCEWFGDIILGTDVNSLVVNPASLTFSAFTNGGPTQWQNLTIGNTTTTPLDFTLTPSQSWLLVEPTSGTTPAWVRVWADPNGLSAGQKNATLQVSAVGSANSPSVPVIFNVQAPPPEFGFNPTSLNFAADQNGTLPLGKNLQITNIGGNSLNWSATKVGTWFNLSSSSGTATSNITITPNTTDLDSGTQSGSILFTAAGASPAEVNLTYTITAPPILVVSPTVIDKEAAIAGGPVEILLTISNGQMGAMNWSLSDNAAWISASPESGIAVSGSPAKVKLTFDPTDLGLGLHTAELTVSSPTATNSPQTVSVSWTLVNAAAIGVNPTSLDFFAKQNGNSPPSQTLEISNLGPGSMTWSVTCTPAKWLSCSPNSGTAPSTLTVEVDSSNSGLGVYNGQISIESNNATNSPKKVPIQLTVRENSPPPAPTLISPIDNETVTAMIFPLVFSNVTDPDGDTVTYEANIYIADSNDPPVFSASDIEQGSAETSVNVLRSLLKPGEIYEWQARAIDSDGAAGDWSELAIFSTSDANSTSSGCNCRSTENSALLAMLLVMSLGLRRIKRRCFRECT